MRGQAPLFVDETILLLGRWAPGTQEGAGRRVAEAFAVAPDGTV